MTTENDPIINNWYFHKDKGQQFMVIAVDQDKELVEMQHFDGNVEETSFRNWYDMEIEIGTAPENWSGATDVGEVDDYGTEVTDTKPEEWDEPLEEFRPPGVKD